MGHQFLLQGIFPTQGLNPGLLHFRQILYCLSHQGSLITSYTYYYIIQYMLILHFMCVCVYIYIYIYIYMTKFNIHQRVYSKMLIPFHLCFPSSLPSQSSQRHLFFLKININVCLVVCSVVSNSLKPHGLYCSVHGIFQTRILEWVVTPYFRGSSWPRVQTCIPRVSCIGKWILYF